MGTFNVSSGASGGDIAAALNYALANIGQGLQVSLATGTINAPLASGEQPIYTLLYRYAVLAFADDNQGNGFSFDPTDKAFYGVNSFWTPNTAYYVPSAPTNPIQYVWKPLSPVASPFPIPPGSLTIAYLVNAPYNIADVTLWPIDQGLPPGYREWNIPPESNQFIDTYNYFAPSTINVEVVDGNIDNGIPGTPILFGDFYASFHTSSSTYNVARIAGFNAISFDPVYNPYPALQAPSYYTTGTLILAPLSAEPTYYTTGTIAMADYTNWNPSQQTTNSVYPVYYDGAIWNSLYEPPIAGSFFSTSSFSITTATNSYVFTFNNTNHSRGISISTSTSSCVVMDGPGIYNVQFSVEIDNSNTNAKDAYIWLRQNGLDIANSNSIATVPGKHGSINGSTILSANIFVETTGTYEYVELAFGAETTDVSFPTVAAGTNPTRPAAPSVILTVDKIN